MTAWEARKVKDRMLCGRKVAGQYVCTGEVGVVRLVPWAGDDGKLHPDRPFAMPPRGWYPDDVGVWRLTARARRKVAAGMQPRGRGGVHRARNAGSSRNASPERWLACCPHCSETNVVCS